MYLEKRRWIDERASNGSITNGTHEGHTTDVDGLGEMACLCIGPSSSGKTLLLKRLNSGGVNEGTSTVETVGTNMVQVPKKIGTNNDGTDVAKRKWESKDIMDIREIGGSLSPLWPSYYSSDKLIMYVIDSSNLFQVSISTVLLMELLSHEKLVGARVLLVLSKADLTDRKKMNHLKFMMRLDTVVAQAGKRISLVEVSSTTGDGVESVRKWLSDHWPKVTKPVNPVRLENY